VPVETLLERCREVGRLKRLGYGTERTYLPGIRRFTGLHGGRTHPNDRCAPEVRAFLPHPAVEQNVAFSAPLVLYRVALHFDLPAIRRVERAQNVGRVSVACPVAPVAGSRALQAR